MTISISVKAAAEDGIDEADRIPTITGPMLEAGVKALQNVGGDIDETKDADLVASIFSAMWNARKA